jgi:hypothetical protein
MEALNSSQVYGLQPLLREVLTLSLAVDPGAIEPCFPWKLPQWNWSSDYPAPKQSRNAV